MCISLKSVSRLRGRVSDLSELKLPLGFGRDDFLVTWPVTLLCKLYHKSVKIIYHQPATRVEVGFEWMKMNVITLRQKRIIDKIFNTYIFLGYFKIILRTYMLKKKTATVCWIINKMWLKAITLPWSPQLPYNFLCQFKRFNTLTKIVVISEDLHTQRSIFLVDKNLVPEKFKEYCIVFSFFKG